MSRQPYPGDPEKARAIQADVSRTAGFVAPLMPCSCGRTPVIVSVGYGLVRASCFCGKQGKNARSEAAATEAWNHEISQRLLEAMR